MCFGLSVGRCVEAPPGKKKPPKPHEGYVHMYESMFVYVRTY
jgi:hypothetical protein